MALDVKATKSAKRKAKKHSRNVNRFRNDYGHVLSKRIFESVDSIHVARLKDPTDIRKQVKASKIQLRSIHAWSPLQGLKTISKIKGI